MLHRLLAALTLASSILLPARAAAATPRANCQSSGSSGGNVWVQQWADFYGYPWNGTQRSSWHNPTSSVWDRGDSWDGGDHRNFYVTCQRLAPGGSLTWSTTVLADQASHLLHVQSQLATTITTSNEQGTTTSTASCTKTPSYADPLSLPEIPNSGPPGENGHGLLTTVTWTATNTTGKTVRDAYLNASVLRAWVSGGDPTGPAGQRPPECEGL